MAYVLLRLLIAMTLSYSPNNDLVSVSSPCVRVVGAEVSFEFFSRSSRRLSQLFIKNHLQRVFNMLFYKRFAFYRIPVYQGLKNAPVLLW